MIHPDIKIRGRAKRGICDLAYCSKEKSLRRKAYELLQRCLETETDPGPREGLEISIKVTAKKNLKSPAAAF
jgi:hypothetical protein